MSDDPIVHYDPGHGLALCGQTGGIVLRLDRYVGCPACLDILQPDRPRPPADKIATLAEWRACVAAAHVAICIGRFGAQIVANESFAHALAREAAKFMAEERLGRPRGEVPADWLAVVDHTSKLPSCAPDGFVQLEHGLRAAIADVDGRAFANVMRAADYGAGLGRLRRMNLA